jgi:hypothetical protein|tara:strand:+ start:371 stop:550 length:180 start_codon:yes stop_codon:yes gene_type:complete
MISFNYFQKEKELLFKPRKMIIEAYFWVGENILFLEPVTGQIRPQGQLVGRAIEEAFKP